MPNLYAKSARLSIRVARISNLAALTLGIIFAFQLSPALPDFTGPLILGLTLISAFTFFVGIVPAVIGWIDPASSPLAKKAILACLATPITGLLSATITTTLLRLT